MSDKPTSSFAISLQAEERIITVRLTKGRLEETGSVEVPGGPAPLVRSGDVIYAGLRNTPGLAALKLSGGKLDIFDSVELDSDPCFVALDNSGKYLFCTYYFAGMVTLHRINDDATVQSEVVQTVKTFDNAHSIWFDQEYRFAYVPHTGPNKLLQFVFDADSGLLSPQATAEATVPRGVEPRHLVASPDGQYFYCANEKASSVTTYRFYEESGTLETLVTVSTLPEQFAGSNSCSQIKISPDGSFLYVANRGHDSIAMFRIDQESRQPVAIGHVGAEKTPRALCMSADGDNFLAAGLDNGVIAVYGIDKKTGRLNAQSTFEAGEKPMWILQLE